MRICAVIDTNVLVSALLSKHRDAATVRVLRAMLNGGFIPLYHRDILEEYAEVMRRPKFRLADREIEMVLESIRRYGLEVEPHPTGEPFVDADDLIFYEVAMEKRDEDAWLVTGNQRHFPVKPFIVTPAEFMAMLEGDVTRK